MGEELNPHSGELRGIGIAAVLKTADRKVMGVRVPHSPLQGAQATKRAKGWNGESVNRCDGKRNPRPCLYYLTMKLEPKAPALEKLLTAIAPNRAKGLCATCGSDKMESPDFTDDLSRKEATISAMCQVCQDGFFNAPEE